MSETTRSMSKATSEAQTPNATPVSAERLGQLRDWVREAEAYFSLTHNGSARDKPAKADLFAVLDEVAALRGEVERLREEVDHRADQRDAALESVGLLSAALARQRPLVEAVMKASVYGADGQEIKAEFDPDDVRKILGACVSLREDLRAENEKKGEKK